MANNTQQNLQLQKIHTTWFMLKLTYGLVSIIAGADKFLNLLTNWEVYLNPALLNIAPLSAIHFLYLVGLIEIIAGLIILSDYTRYGAYIVALWLIAIAVNLITLGFYDIAVRDVVMAIGALALAQLTEVLESK